MPTPIKLDHFTVGLNFLVKLYHQGRIKMEQSQKLAVGEKHRLMLYLKMSNILGQ